MADPDDDFRDIGFSWRIVEPLIGQISRNQLMALRTILRSDVMWPGTITWCEHCEYDRQYADPYVWHSTAEFD